MRTLALWLPLLALGCGAAPVAPDPCSHGGCQAGPLEAPPVGEQPGPRKPGKHVRDEDQVDVLRCKQLMAENPSMAPAQCRVQVGPLRIGPNQGANGAGVGVTVTNSEPTDLENPTRLNVEGEQDPEGRR